jgi:hypothetical protein
VGTRSRLFLPVSVGVEDQSRLVWKWYPGQVPQWGTPRTSRKQNSRPGVEHRSRGAVAAATNATSYTIHKNYSLPSIQGYSSPFSKRDNKVSPLLNSKPRKLIPAHVSRLTSYIKAEGSASPWKHHQSLIILLNILLSIAYFAWGRVIIYDDNLSYRSLSRTKRNIYIYFWMKRTPTEQFALRLHEAFWDLRITRLSQLHRHI